MVIVFGGLELITGVLSLIGVASSTGIPRGLGQFGQIVVLIAALDFTILEILTVVGCVFAIFTPNKKGTLAFAITALSLSGVALIVKIIWFLVPYFNDGGQAYGLMQGFVGLADVGGGFRGFSIALPPGVTSGKGMVIVLQILFFSVIFSVFIIYPLYLRALARQLKERYLEGGCIRALGFASGALGAKIIVVILLFAISGEIGKGVLILLCILRMAASGAVIAFGIMYMGILKEMRSRVD